MVRNKFNKIIIKSITIASILTMITPNIITATRFTQSVTSRDPDTTTAKSNSERIIVLDPGHGKSFNGMTDSEYTANGFIKNSSGVWGEWRHFKNGTYGQDCQESGCAGTNDCWYPAANGERTAENPINLANASAAKKYLEQMGYTVRMTREDDSTHPSFGKRAAYCFPNNDTSQSPDAELYVCIHSNASTNDASAMQGTVRGTCYLAAGGSYTQKHIKDDFVEKSNKAADIINTKIAESGIGLENDGKSNLDRTYLIAFNKNPVPTAYLEIGYFDNKEDLAILQTKSDEIGKAIAEGINEYLQGIEPSENTGSTSGSGSGSNGTTVSRGTIKITSNQKKFLGLWKNSEGKYIPYYENEEKAKYDPNGKIVKYGTYGSAAGAILNADYWLFDLLSATDRTQQHLQLMKYLMQEYSRYKLWSRI